MDNIIRIGDQLFKYQIIYKNIKSINIKLKPNNIIVITANKSIHKELILNWLIKRKSWILKTNKRIQQSLVIQKNNFLDFNENINNYYLGQKVLVELINSKQSAKIVYQAPYLYINAVDIKKAERIYEKHIYKELNALVWEYTDSALLKLKEYNLLKPKIIFKNIKSYWGSYRQDINTITFNLHLIQLPHDLIEYVVCHEIIHLIYLNHSKYFYALLDKVYPNRKEAEQKLKKIVII